MGYGPIGISSSPASNAQRHIRFPATYKCGRSHSGHVEPITTPRAHRRRPDAAAGRVGWTDELVHVVDAAGAVLLWRLSTRTGSGPARVPIAA